MSSPCSSSICSLTTPIWKKLVFWKCSPTLSERGSSTSFAMLSFLDMSLVVTSGSSTTILASGSMLSHNFLQVLSMMLLKNVYQTLRLIWRHSTTPTSRSTSTPWRPTWRWRTMRPCSGETNWLQLRLQKTSQRMWTSKLSHSVKGTHFIIEKLFNVKYGNLFKVRQFYKH